MGNKASPFQLMIDPAEALAAARRLRAHLPPYAGLQPMGEDGGDGDEAAVLATTPDRAPVSER